MTSRKEKSKEYIIEITPRILKLLGPHLYTNIYYVLAELIANSYDAGARNVYIIQDNDSITIEDDGSGMSYAKGDVKKYLNVAMETRTTEKESYVKVGEEKRRKIGRKGVGKLAALSVSENVLVMTIKNEEKAGFILSQNVKKNRRLTPLKDEEIKFNYVKGDGTSIVMTNPLYGLNKTAKTIKKNLLKIFPLVNSNFRIHIITDKGKVTINKFDKEMIKELGALILLGEKHHGLSKHFDPSIDKKDAVKDLIKKQEIISFPLKLKDKKGEEKVYDLIISGWIGAYRSTTDKKNDLTDFPDNFISIISNGKLGEYNILPLVGKNRLIEVFIVGQLHADLFEETSLPDMSLSNRQGYKTDDPRYQKLISHVREKLLPEILSLRQKFVSHKRGEKDMEKIKRQKEYEKDLIKKVEAYKKAVTKKVDKKFEEKFGKKPPEEFGDFLKEEMNTAMNFLNLKTRIDLQKKKILISHTGKDKPLAEIIYKMLLFNNVPEGDIIYTNSNNDCSRIPEGMDVFDYLRMFFIESYSTEKIYVIYITSDEMCQSWTAVSEVGAGWIVRSKHKIFTINDHRPKAPLDIGPEWHKSTKEGEDISMIPVEEDKFIVKIIKICEDLGYSPKSKEANKKELSRYLKK